MEQNQVFKLNDDIGRCGLTWDNSRRSNSTIEKFELGDEEIRLFQNDEGTEYKLSIVYSMWNRKYFLKYLNDYTNIWDWEVNASYRAIDDGWKVIGTEPAPLDFTHLFKHGGLRQDWNYRHSTNQSSQHIYLTQEEQNFLKGIYNI